MNEVYVSTRYTAECYECGWVSQPMVDEHEAEAEGRRHACPKSTGSESDRG